MKLHPSGERPRGDRQRRLNWATRGMGEPLIGALQRDRSPEAAHLRKTDVPDQDERIARLIMDRADPTANKRFTAWLVREYTAGRLILEDLGTANETLTLFQRYAPRLKPAERDIQRYGSLAAAWEAVRGFAERDEVNSNRTQKALDRAKAYEESRILRQDPDGFTVAVPLTEFAAKWWGKGTRWCTAAEKNNAFWQYHREAPLIVIIIPEVEKLQMWLTDSDFQFRDAADEAVSAEVSKKLWRWIEPFLSHALETHGPVLEFIPLVRRGYDRCLAAVRQDGMALQWVPRQHRTHELCLAAVQQDGWALQCLLEKFHSAELYLAAVQSSGRALEWVPEECRTAALYLTAVESYGPALEWVPEEQRTYDLCLAAVKQDGFALKRVPKQHRTPGLCLVAVQQNGEALELVPEEQRTYGVCLAAVRQDGRALRFVLSEHRSREVYRAAVTQDGLALPLVPEEQRTYDLCLATVRQYGSALEWVPRQHRTHELCLTAVKQYVLALWWVPEEYLTQDLCLAAVQHDGRALEWVRNEHRTSDLCLAAVQQNGRALQWVPEEHRTPEIYLAALANHRMVLEMIPDHLHAELLAQLPPEPAPSLAWSDTLLDTWEERLKPLPDQTVTPHV